MGQTLEALLGAAQTLPVSTVIPVNRTAIAHETSGPFWIIHCNMANEIGSGNGGGLIAWVNLLLFQAIRLSAALSGGFWGAPASCLAAAQPALETWEVPRRDLAERRPNAPEVVAERRAAARRRRELQRAPSRPTRGRMISAE